MPAALTSTAFDIYASLVLTLSSMSSSSCLFPSSHLWRLPVQSWPYEVAGGSGWLRPLLALRPELGAEHLT